MARVTLWQGSVQQWDAWQEDEMKLFSRAEKPPGKYPIQHTDAEWQQALGSEAYRVLRKHETERPGTSALDTEHRKGTFCCAGCGAALFSSDTKFESGTGWPSFFKPIEGGVDTSEDRNFFMHRTEAHCANCGGHLGHVFCDGPPPTGRRYCINGVAMNFRPETQADQ
jgi:peptide-methionine (R)-S-oxide reductase